MIQLHESHVDAIERFRTTAMAHIARITGPSAFALHSKQLRGRLILPIVRYASTVPERPAVPKPRLLEKPERFNPPSHSARLPRKNKTYGAPVTPQEAERQKTRQYPHMMPPEGSFMFWFLTNRIIHVIISFGILMSLVLGIWFQNFIHSTPYKDMLPPNSMFFAHPWQFLRRYWDIYDLTTAYNTQQVMERRKAKIDDVQKRSNYRKAHGLDTGDKAGLFGGWTAKTDAELMGPALRTSDVEEALPKDVELQGELDAPAATAISDISTAKVKSRPKWFGIW